MEKLNEVGTVHDCEILIIGGALSGLTAAITAKEADKDIDILIVDKAYASKGWAGKAARTAGLISYVDKNNDPEEFVKFYLKTNGFFLNDQDMLSEFAYNSRRLVERSEKWGIKLERDENGEHVRAQWPFPWVTGAIDPDMCVDMANYAKKQGVRFLDRIVIVDLLKNEGRLCGACGFDIGSGEFHIFRANTIVLACGSQNFDVTPCWQSTGISQAMAFRAGAKFRNCEFACMGDFARVDAKDERILYYGQHSGAHTGHDHLYYGEENISQKYRPGLHSSYDPDAANAWYQEYKQGHRPIECNIEKFKAKGGGDEFFRFHPEAFRRYMREHEIAGYDFNHEVFQVVPGIISEMSAIYINRETETSVPGLFAIGDAAGNGSARGGACPTPPGKIHGTGLMNALFLGSKCGPASTVHARAAKYYGIRPEISVEDVIALKEKTFAPLNRKEGISPYDVIHEVQEAIAPVDYIAVKTEERIKEALSIVDRAEKMLAEMSASDYHEISKCIDAESMVICARLIYTAALARKESRGFHLREDYPQRNDEEWLKWVILNNENGEIHVSYEDVPIEHYRYQIKDVP